MNTMLDDNVKSFKDLEKFLFDYLRKDACEIIKEFSERKDHDLFLNRDKKSISRQRLETNNNKVSLWRYSI